MADKDEVVPIMNIVKSFEEMYGVVFLMEAKGAQFIYRYISSEAKEIASLDDRFIGEPICVVYPNYISAHLSALYSEAKESRKPVVVGDKLNMELIDEVARLVIMPVIQANDELKYFISYTDRSSSPTGADVDLITGLPSYHLFVSKLKDKLQTVSNTPIALCYFKLRQEKNKEAGMQKVDQAILITELAKRILNTLPEVESELARVVGDEFICFFSAQHDAIAWVKELQQIISIPFPVGEFEVVMETAVGISFQKFEPNSELTVVNEAYHAMLQAKLGDGNTLKVFHINHQNEEMRPELYLVQELKEAIVNNELVVFFQPIVSVKTGEVHYEALLRWFSSRLGLVPTDSFIAAAEESGVILEIDFWVMGKVCEHLAAHHEELHHVSINLSIQTLESPDLETRLLSSCSKYGIDPGMLEIELTEHTLLEDETSLIKKLRCLRESGFKVAIDDFGMRYASFNYLRVLPVDKIKIDKAFVQNLKRNSKEDHIITSILALAKKIGVNVTAEGVETVEQAEILVAASCDELQGYLFGKPAPYEHVQTAFEQAKKQWSRLL
ncbi:putative bifunctional diguanylate cyclase/phosphodiesterase [Halalkalibacter okhensis]|uniref:Diguanylate cyclase n=1 Tax=Halalkalibacter okhensis TaxID=333138 RepID=A0A0B0IB97_9BACI|nr:bifunctional diguanylate cyclase/phosphodiesterase [Halalkalibacter okhensis]KHF38142.1 hypothetical protein LQ50_23045 [Halalkalibacter okhensis]